MEHNVNNWVELCGTPVERPRLSHVGGGEEYYTFPLEIERLSGFSDRINIIVRRDKISNLEIDEGCPRLAVAGELRSFNNKQSSGSRLVITVLARELYFTDEEDSNFVCLTGVLCKPPNLRKTPMGRQICDLMLAVNRRYGRSDYLPCIAWGRVAQSAAELGVGESISFEGRIQSRKYIKTENDKSSERTAYEVSIAELLDSGMD